jgi:lipopolysaccharide/colanic/teichoic acid biosynthesis glycosyltransferase
MGVVALCIAGSMGRPILFRQIRPGYHGTPFAMIKFRTMAPARPSLPEVQRINRLGRLLRASSLDELPELLNVLRGEMSLVGPRPLLPEYLPLYSPEQARRHDVKPGITGWAQVNGRNATTWEERLAFDTWYVDNRSVFLDLRILALTPLVVLFRRGINQRPGVAMEKFVGSAD